MHRLMDESCSNCNKFSHCNNNGLICVSRYKAKEQECEELKNQLYFSTKHKLVLEAEYTSELNKYKQAFNEIEKLMPKLKDSTECAYGDFDCENCSSLDEDTVCTYKLKKIILDIIREAKEN